MELSGPMRLLAPLIARSFSKGSDENFARLKRVLEDNAAG